MAKPTHVPKSDAEREAAESQIVEMQRDVDYDTKEYPVETVVHKYLQGIDEDENEIFIPDYQRDFTWDVARQSKFIESVMIGLPIPYVFVADIGDKPGSEGRLEVVDGSQRIRTLAHFVKGTLVLTGLEKLTALNGFRFTDLTPSRQRRFNRRTLRMIELTEKADEEVRRDMFERINTGSVELRDMEKRRGILAGPVNDFLTECANTALFKELVPLSDAAVKRREREELVLRFFAYLEGYEQFHHSVVGFLNAFVKAKNQSGFDKNTLRAEFTRMLEFVRDNFPNGFKKAATHNRTSRIRFEALSVGVALALRQHPQTKMTDAGWLSSPELRRLTTSDASNSRAKVKQRIEYVRDRVLGASA
jgi:hypothetical protein